MTRTNKILIGVLALGTVSLFGANAFSKEAPTHFAHIDADGVVTRVIVADQKFIDSGAVGNPSEWVATDPTKPDYAGKGHKFDKAKKTFEMPKAKSATTTR